MEFGVGGVRRFPSEFSYSPSTLIQHDGVTFFAARRVGSGTICTSTEYIHILSNSDSSSVSWLLIMLMLVTSLRLPL